MSETRQFQFRAWDKRKGRFVPLFSLDQLSDPFLIVTQATGVRDYFGSLIWEGDIMKWCNYDPGDGMYFEMHFEVAFRRGCFGTLGLKGVDGEEDLTEFYADSIVDAIAGNVFEHAYLLGQRLDLEWPSGG